MASNYKRFIQHQFEKAKSTASEFISSKNEEQEDYLIRLHPDQAAELQAIADLQQTTVQEIVNDIVIEFLQSASHEPVPISVDQKEDNPLLYLDGICRLKD
ncbi:hypothetical protein [Paenibacillus aestuarii]|uniref:Uncharacterized protein n=1 Tax=Paenibacillus aestuarii TaxID=516965 RepID=A0ABW0K7H9_9BACL|nr:hypothetical protein [Paenibacillus aestuarii]